MTQAADPNAKASAICRMVRSSVELPDDRREALLLLHQRVEQLWRRRAEAQAKRVPVQRLRSLTHNP